MQMIALPTAARQSTLVRWPNDLPPAALDPRRVTIRCDLDEMSLGLCGECEDDTYAAWRLTYRRSPDGPDRTIDVCGDFCLADTLRWVLGPTCNGHDVTLILPRQWAPLPANLADLAGLLPLPCDQSTSDHRPCTTLARYVVAWTDLAHHGRRELTCTEHLAGLVDYADEHGDHWAGPSVNRLPDNATIGVAA